MKCVQCKKEKKIHSRNLCASCYGLARRDGTLSQYPKMKQRKEIICSECKENAILHAKGMCERCYGRLKARRHYAENPDRHRAAARKSRRKHRGEYKEKRREWRERNPNKAAEYRHKRRANTTGESAFLTEHQWQRILHIFRNACAYCGIHSVPLEKEHFVPIARRGTFSADNIVPSCRSCNAKKHTKTGKEFLASLATNRSLS